MIKVDNTLDIDTSKFKDWKVGCTMPMYFIDATKMFGQPIYDPNGDHLWKLMEIQEDGTEIYAELYLEWNEYHPEKRLTFEIRCHCDRSFEIVGEYIGEKIKDGVEYETTAIKTEGKDERIELSLDNKAENGNYE